MNVLFSVVLLKINLLTYLLTLGNSMTMAVKCSQMNTQLSQHKPSHSNGHSNDQAHWLEKPHGRYKAPVTPAIRPGCDLATTEHFWKRRQIVERTHGWSQMSWMIAMAKSVAARSMVMFKMSNLRFQIVSGRIQVLRDRTTSRAWLHHQLWMIADHEVARLVAQLVVTSNGWWCHPLCDITFSSATTRDLSRFVARLFD